MSLHLRWLVLYLVTLPAHAEWPQLAHDASRSGATATELRPPFARKWYRLFADEGLQSGVQPVVAGDRLFIATLRGRLHAIDTRTGKDVWAYDGGTEGGPALHAAAVADGLVFVALGETLHAVRVEDGRRAWTLKTGALIWNAPAVHAGAVYFGGRDGHVRAVNAATGELRWSATLGAPVLHSPAVDPRGNRLVVGAEDMRVYAFDLATGARAWRSDKLPGVSFRGYHPVVAPDGSVVVTVTPGAGGDAMQQVLLDTAREVFGQFSSWRIKSEDEKRRIRAANFELMKNPHTYRRQLDYLRDRLTKEPALQTLFVLDPASGTRRFVAPVVYAESMNGPASPPLVTAGGRVVVKYGALLRSRYEHYSPFLNVGYLDTATGHVEPVMDQSRTYGWHDSLLLVHDEQSQLVAAGRMLINTHQDNVNAMDLSTLAGDPKPWAVNVHEVNPGVAASLYAHVLRGRPLPQGWEWLPRGTAVYGGGSVVDTPVVVAGDSFYFLPTHELNAGVAVVAYAMDRAGESDRKTKPEAILKEKLLPEDGAKIAAARWDWDTLEADRLKGTLVGLPEVPLGTRLRPRTVEGARRAAAIDAAALERMILSPPEVAERPAAAGAAAAAGPWHVKLDAAVEELVSRDWRPLLLPAGKAPAEAYQVFAEPAETLYTLALAYPQLAPDVRARVKARVAALRAPGGPLAGPMGRDAYDAAKGEIRSAYDEPPASLLKIGRPVARAAGTRLYPFWLWAHVTGDFEELRRDWGAIRTAFRPGNVRGAPDLGNDRLSGLIAFARLSQRFDDPATARAALDAAVAGVRDRLAYELAHTEGGLITTSGLRSIMGRWHFLNADLGRIFRAFAGDVHRRLMDVYVDHHRPAWHVAWNVELLWRNENAFSFPDLSADIFTAKALILDAPADALGRFVDIPWCKGDEYYVQKLALLCARSPRKGG